MLVICRIEGIEKRLELGWLSSRGNLGGKREKLMRLSRKEIYCTIKSEFYKTDPSG